MHAYSLIVKGNEADAMAVAQRMLPGATLTSRGTHPTYSETYVTASDVSDSAIGGWYVADLGKPHPLPLGSLLYYSTIS